MKPARRLEAPKIKNSICACVADQMSFDVIFSLERSLRTYGLTCEAGIKRSSPPTPLLIMPRKRGMMGFFFYFSHYTGEAFLFQNHWSFFSERWGRSSSDLCSSPEDSRPVVRMGV